MNYLTKLSSLIQTLEKEYKKYQNLLKTPFQKKYSLQITKEKIKKLLTLLKIELTSLQKILSLKNEIKTELERSENLKKKNIQIQNLLHTSIKTLTQNIPYFNLTSSLSSNRLNINSINKIDLINMSTRINTQFLYPNDVFYISSNAFLKQYPTDDIQMNNSILKYDLSENNRLLPPIADPPGGHVSKGTLVSLKIDKRDFERFKKSDVFFKYSMNDSIPSSFSGELYYDNKKIFIEKDCEIKVCACKFGFKDSIVVNFNFTVSGGNVRREIKKTDINQQNYLIRPTLEIIGGSSYKPFVLKDDEGSPHQYSASGSAYQPNYNRNDNEYEYDEI